MTGPSTPDRGVRRGGAGARGSGPRRPGAPAGSPRAYTPARADLPRLAAYDVLRAVSERQAYANLVLPPLLKERGITGRDAAFATELTYGALRAGETLDAVLARCCTRPLAEVDAALLDVLRLGAYQLLRTRVPRHAAVSATVELARQVLTAGPGSFANAVLRKVAATEPDAWMDLITADLDPLGAMALRHSHPRWIASAFRDALGGSLAETEAALAADDERPVTHLVARPGRIDRDALLAQAGDEAVVGPWSPYAVRMSGGLPGGLAAVADRSAAVQDEGSQLCALALAGAPLEGPDAVWVDLCAGPGGKAALLGALAEQRGAHVLAVERAAHRAQLVRRTTRGLPVLTVRADGRRPPLAPGTVDRVLVDAPCTGLGALRRRPESRWRRRPDDVAELVVLQRALAEQAARLLRPGGVMAYVVCSPHLPETLLAVRHLLRAVDGLEQIDARPLVGDLPDLGPGPSVQLWPHRHGTDAMFLALLRRTG